MDCTGMQDELFFPLKPIYNFNPDVLDNGNKTAAHKKWDVVLKNFRENKIWVYLNKFPLYYQ